MPPRQPDWWCSQCNFKVFGSKPSCSKCGTRNPALTGGGGGGTGRSNNNKPPDWNCPNCDFVVFGSKAACFKCGAKNPHLASASATATATTTTTTSTSLSAPPPRPTKAQTAAAVAWPCPNCQVIVNENVCLTCGQSNPNKVSNKNDSDSDNNNDNDDNQSTTTDSTTTATTNSTTRQRREKKGRTPRDPPPREQKEKKESTTRQAKPPRTADWTCTTCSMVIYGTKPACAKCGAQNPYLHKLPDGSYAPTAAGAASAIDLPPATPGQKRLPDWDCPNCKIIIFGSRPACRKCGTANPRLQQQTESLLVAEKQESKKLVEELAKQVEMAKQAVAANSNSTNNKKNANDDDDQNQNQNQQENIISSTAAKLEELMAQINAAQSRLAVAEQAVAAGPASIQVTPPPHWDEVSPVFPSAGFKKIDITEVPVDPENGVMTSYKAAIEEFIKKASRDAVAGVSDPSRSSFKTVKRVYRIQNDRLWVYYCSNRSLMHSAPAVIPPTSTLLPEKDYFEEMKNGADDTSGDDIFRKFISQRGYGLRRQVNETLLFHGTNAAFVDIICEQGFDERVSNLHGLYGAGWYGAENAIGKAFNYIRKDAASGSGFAFLTRVCLGKYTKLEGKTDSSLRRAPDGTDCVIGTPNRSAPREFIVYDRRQTYPEYLVELQ